MDVPSTENGIFLKNNLKGTFEELVRSVSNDVFEGTLSYEFSRTLHEMEVITKTQEKECASINDNLRRNEFLYDIIFKRNLDLGGKCIVALEQSGNDHIIEKLREKIDPSFISSNSGELENPVMKPGSTKAPKQGIHQILDPSGIPLSNTASKNIAQPIQDQQHETSVEIEEEAKLVPHWPSTKNKDCFTEMLNTASLLAMLILLLGVLSLMITAFAQESQHDQLPQLQTNAGLRPTKQPKIDIKKTTKSPSRKQPNAFPLTINSPRTPFPKKLGSTSTRLNLTIASPIKFNWERWKIPNGNKVHTLTLQGCFNESDINYFLVKMQKLTALFLHDSKCLCQEFSGKTSENKTTQPVVVHNNLKHLHISAFSECELLYKYLEFGIYFPKLKSVTLKRPYIASTNVKHFDSFIWKHRFSLTKIQLIKGTLCETCELFSRRSNRKLLLLGELRIAKFSFSDSNSTAAIRTLRNLSHGSPGLSQFQTNASCAAVDIRILQEFWKHLDRSKSQLCQVR